jgi:hypothetical protein
MTSDYYIFKYLEVTNIVVTGQRYVDILDVTEIVVTIAVTSKYVCMLD